MQYFSNNLLARFCFASNKRTRTSQAQANNVYDALENRRVLASIFLSASGELFISGGSSDDVGAFKAIGSKSKRASLVLRVKRLRRVKLSR